MRARDVGLIRRAGVRKRLRCKRLHVDRWASHRRQYPMLATIDATLANVARLGITFPTRSILHESSPQVPSANGHGGCEQVMLTPMRSTLSPDESLRLAVLLERDGIVALSRRTNCSANTLRAARSGRRLSGPTVTVLRHLLAPPPPARAA